MLLQLNWPGLVEAKGRLLKLSKERLATKVSYAVMRTLESVNKAVDQRNELARTVGEQFAYRDEKGNMIPYLGYQDDGKVINESPVSPAIHLNPNFRGPWNPDDTYQKGQLCLCGARLFEALKRSKGKKPGEEGHDDAWKKFTRSVGKGKSKHETDYVVLNDYPITVPDEYHKRATEVDETEFEVRVHQFDAHLLERYDEDGNEVSAIEPEKLWLPMIIFDDEEELEPMEIEEAEAEDA